MHTTRLLLTALLSLQGAHALAGRPMATEDAGVLEAKSCEVESFVGRSRADGEPSAHQASVQLGCGVGWNSQLALALARERSDADRLSRWTVLGKTRLNPDASEEAAQFTVAWSWAADRGTGQSWSHSDTSVHGVMSLPLGSTHTVHANLGWSRSARDQISRTDWALGMEHKATDTVDLTLETYASDRERSPWLQAGLRWAAVPDQLYVDASWGLQTGGPKGRAATLGLRWAF